MSATYNSEHDASSFGGGWQKTDRRSGRSRKAEDDYDPWAEYEEVEDYCSARGVPAWPQQQVARPSVAFLVKHYAPIPTRPKALDVRIVQEHHAHKEKLKSAADAVATAEVAEKKALAAAATEEAEQKKLNAWSRTQTKQALLQRLKREAAEALDATKKAKAELENIAKSGELINSIVVSQKKAVEGFDKYRTAVHELWDCEQGYLHRPLRTEADLFGQYNPVSRGKPDAGGWVRYEMAEGTDMEKLCREFDRGGHEQIRTDGLIVWFRADVMGDCSASKAAKDDE